jgi:hypothetical protein
MTASGFVNGAGRETVLLPWTAQDVQGTALDLPLVGRAWGRAANAVVVCGAADWALAGSRGGGVGVVDEGTDAPVGGRLAADRQAGALLARGRPPFRCAAQGVWIFEWGADLRVGDSPVAASTSSPCRGGKVAAVREAGPDRFAPARTLALHAEGQGRPRGFSDFFGRKLLECLATRVRVSCAVLELWQEITALRVGAAAVHGVLTALDDACAAQGVFHPEEARLAAFGG